jgi:hypothetical protein
MAERKDVFRRKAPPAHRPEIEIISVSGNPTDEELAVIKRALEEHVKEERQARTPSLWLRGGRAQGRRLGMFDYRDRFSSADAWRLSTRFPFGGREYPGLNGRGDAK